jgi:hypothetical protein
LPWIEIDFPEDYYDAINKILPQIEEAELLSVRPLALATAALGEHV